MCFIVLSGIYANISLFHSYSEVNVDTQIQSVSRSDVDQHLEMTSTAMNVSGDQDN